MSNQPQVRPWFRLASLRSVPAPAPAPAPESRRPLGLPTFRTASAPPSPQTQPPKPSDPTPPRPAPAVTAAQSASLPTSPVQKAAANTTSSSVPSSPSLKATQPASSARVTSPTKSPKTTKPAVQSPMQSPELKLVTPPPSPLNLPPSQLKINSEIERPKVPVEAEPKTVLVQKTTEKPKQGLNGNGALQRESRETRKLGIAHHEKQVTAKEIETKGKGNHRKISDSEDSAGMRVITLAGENRGAYMEIIQSPKKPNHVHKKGNSNTNSNGSESEKSSSEGKTNRKDKSHKERTISSTPMAAYMNSNVQSVNNSLLYDTSCSHHDPGVRLSLSKKPFGDGFHLKEHVDGQQN